MRGYNVLEANRFTASGVKLLALAVTVFASTTAGSLPQSEVREPARHVEQVSITTDDSVKLQAFLHYPVGSKPDVVVFKAHPRLTASREPHPLLPPFLEKTKGRVAIFEVTSRFAGEEPIIEERVLDVAAGMKFLRKRGFRTVVFFAHSGGGGFNTFYQRQAETAPPARISATPWGDPPDLNRFELPKADAIILSNAHEAEGPHMMHQLDASIMDETNPFAVDPSLDMFNPKNGFRTPPASSQYPKEFVARYREAQRARAARLDAIALSMIDEQRSFQQMMSTPEFKNLPVERQLDIRRRALTERFMTVYGTEADPAHLDLQLRATGAEAYSHGRIGSTFGPRTDITNYARPRVRHLPPRVWLSTRSGLSSRSNLYEDISRVSCPLLVVTGTAESGIPAGEKLKYFEAAKVKDKTIVWIEGANHGYQPEGPKAGKGDQLDQFSSIVARWLEQRFFSPPM